jgi:ABC-2 type transport system permease protein
VLVPPLFFPAMLAAVNASAFGRSTNLAAFPEVDSFLDFLLPTVIIQSVLFGGVAGGSDIALDIENGFFDRLLASPIWRPSILIGRLAGAAAIGGFSAVFFTVLLGGFGVEVKAGMAGVVVLVLMGILGALAIGGVTAAIGIRTGSQETVQNSFPLVFILLFLSSAFFPTELMSGWYKTLAQTNPITWTVDAARSLVIVGWSWGEAAQAIGVAGGAAALTIGLAARQLRVRIAAA